jgi:hypothetical protein
LVASREIIAPMRVQPISNATESLGVTILRRTLSGRSWSVAPSVSIQSVIRKDEGLSEEAFSLYTRGHFDCVVYRDDDRHPLFAVEFDGFGHDKPRQAALDRLKNLFCLAAGLPLLRLGTHDLVERERMSVLEWLSTALIDWLDQIDDDPEEGDYPALYPPAEVDAGFDLDEEGPLFESEHPFPANSAIADRLLSEHGIAIGSALREPGGLPQIAMDSSSGGSRLVASVQWPGKRTFELAPASEFAVSHCDFTVHDRSRVVHTGVGIGRFAWAHRLPEQLDALSVVRSNNSYSAAQIRLRLERRLSPLDTGWWESAGVARELARYDALSQVEQWARHEARAVRSMSAS